LADGSSVDEVAQLLWFPTQPLVGYPERIAVMAAVFFVVQTGCPKGNRVS